jgi:Flp pilus assembly protein CpaB
VPAVADPTSPPASRLRQPKWTDTRLVAGVLMVLVAVVAGAAVISGADRSVRVWAARRDLSAGTTVERGDLVARRVRLFGPDLKRYGDARSDLAGRVLVRDIGAGDLIPLSALDVPPGGATRIVGLPMSRAHALDGNIERGNRVDVIATRKTSGGGFVTYAVARSVLVWRVSKPSGGFGAGKNDLVVMLQVEPAQALPLAAALQSAELDLTLVRPGANGPGDVGAGSVTSGPAPRATAAPVGSGATPRPTP